MKENFPKIFRNENQIYVPDPQTLKDINDVCGTIIDHPRKESDILYVWEDIN